ncbi:hypothetical protein ACFLIM_11075 [Nonomuraea sp. M3C6]|uniref:PAS domain-containing protein n=1 Tax=Nonomuraea marmarensis TaxID=3351344 RepID=A0ABW7A8R0_9ACTN
MDGDRLHGIDGLAFDVPAPAPVGIAVTSGPDHRVLYMNRMCRSLFGERPVRAPFRDAFSERDYFPLFDRVFATGEPVVLTRVGSRRRGHDRATPSLSRAWT